jgi:hypothetical protein
MYGNKFKLRYTRYVVLLMFRMIIISISSPIARRGNFNCNLLSRKKRLNTDIRLCKIVVFDAVGWVGLFSISNETNGLKMGIGGSRILSLVKVQN